MTAVSTNAAGAAGRFMFFGAVEIFPCAVLVIWRIVWEFILKKIRKGKAQA